MMNRLSQLSQSLLRSTTSRQNIENKYIVVNKLCKSENVELININGIKYTDETEIEEAITSVNTDKLNELACGYYESKNNNLAVKYFTIAAEKNHVIAQYNLAMCYYHGYGVENDYMQAAKWFKAAEQGHADRQYALAMSIYDNRGVIRLDRANAENWLEKAAVKGHLEAQNRLIKILEKRAEQGQIEEQCRLGDCYYHGEWVARNFEQAIKWYTKAAEQGYAVAQCRLGKCYYYGCGVNKNHKQAVIWFTKATEQGYEEEDVLYLLGRCYYDGTGVKKNMEQAEKWLNKFLTNIGHFWGCHQHKYTKLMLEKITEIKKLENIMLRNEVFISYTHSDSDILEELKVSLNALKRSHDEIIYWYDGMIETGQKWNDEIKLHIKKAKIAILMISEAFLVSDFVYYEELPELLKAAENEEAIIIWVPVEISQVKSIKLKNDKGLEICIADYQSVCDPKKPLRDMKPNERKKVYISICSDIKKAYGISS